MKIEIVHKRRGHTKSQTTEFSGSKEYAYAQALEYIAINTPIQVEVIRLTTGEEQDESAKGFRTSSAV